MAKLSMGLGSQKFITDESWLEYKTLYAKGFRILKSEITGVSLDGNGAGKRIVKINGSGTTLAQVELPLAWANKAQTFILTEIGKI